MSPSPPLLKMEQSVQQTIRTRNLLHPGERLFVAVSGGPDSVALLACLVALRSRWDWEIMVGHVNHGLRGPEREADAQFVQTLGERWGLPVKVTNLELKKSEVKLQKGSLQELARNARYAVLEQWVRDMGASKLALGHTADDQAETVLLWMLRGSGTGGLAGIPPKRAPGIIRPLIDIARNEILAYLHERGLVYRTDSSNTQPIYLRNRIRQDLVPHLKTFSPGIVRVLTRQADLLRDDHTYLEEISQKAIQHMCSFEKDGTVRIDTGALCSLPLPIRRRVVRCCMQRFTKNSKSPRFDVVEGVLHQVEQGHSGWMTQIKGVEVSQEYDQLLLRPRNREREFQESSDSQTTGLPIPSEIVWSSTGQRLCIEYKQSEPVTSSNALTSVYFDAETFTPELAVRSWVPGDTFCPKGLGGRKKKLQDFFSDIKLPRSQRNKVPLVVAPEGILWVGGLREDERFQVSSTTKSVVMATISDE